MPFRGSFAGHHETAEYARVKFWHAIRTAAWAHLFIRSTSVPWIRQHGHILWGNSWPMKKSAHLFSSANQSLDKHKQDMVRRISKKRFCPGDLTIVACVYLWYDINRSLPPTTSASYLPGSLVLYWIYVSRSPYCIFLYVSGYQLSTCLPTSVWSLIPYLNVPQLLAEFTSGFSK
jgi:hypothetical protein